MNSLKYRIIKSEKQYQTYCEILENLVNRKNKELEDEIELLTFLVEKWEDDHIAIKNLDPIQLVKTLMLENNLKAVHLAEILEISKGTVSKVLNYRKGLSKATIRKLSEHFKISQEAFNKPYRLKSEASRLLHKRKITKKREGLVNA